MGQLTQVQGPTMSEKLCLKWNEFQDSINTAFGNLRNENEFSDVTLVCEDGQQVEAHKVILAASSPFFQNLLGRNKHPHPLIYMRGVKSEDLVAIVDFLYMGEANIYQENLDSFLAIAEELNLKGLTNNDNENKTIHQFDEHLNFKKSKPKARNFKMENIATYENVTIDTETRDNETAVAVTNYELASVNISNIEDLEAKVKSMMTKSQNKSSSGSFALMCTVCGKEGQGIAIKDHIEANHLEGVSLPCNFCEKTFRSRAGLRQHIPRNHRK